MRILATVLILLLPGPVAAEPRKAEPQKPPAPVATNPCAHYGAGFVQLPGTSTCVKLSGSVQIDVGRR